MKYPKLFDGPHAEGEAAARANQRVDTPYQTHIGPGFTATKRGQFSDVSVDPTPHKGEVDELFVLGVTEQDGGLVFTARGSQVEPPAFHTTRLKPYGKRMGPWSTFWYAPSGDGETHTETIRLPDYPPGTQAANPLPTDLYDRTRETLYWSAASVIAGKYGPPFDGAEYSLAFPMVAHPTPRISTSAEVWQVYYPVFPASAGVVEGKGSGILTGLTFTGNKDYYGFDIQHPYFTKVADDGKALSGPHYFPYLDASYNYVGFNCVTLRPNLHLFLGARLITPTVGAQQGDEVFEHPELCLYTSTDHFENFTKSLFPATIKDVVVEPDYVVDAGVAGGMPWNRDYFDEADGVRDLTQCPYNTFARDFVRYSRVIPVSAEVALMLVNCGNIKDFSRKPAEAGPLWEFYNHDTSGRWRLIPLTISDAGVELGGVLDSPFTDEVGLREVIDHVALGNEKAVVRVCHYNLRRRLGTDDYLRWLFTSDETGNNFNPYNAADADGSTIEFYEASATGMMGFAVTGLPASVISSRHLGYMTVLKPAKDDKPAVLIMPVWEKDDDSEGYAAYISKDHARSWKRWRTIRQTDQFTPMSEPRLYYTETRAWSRIEHIGTRGRPTKLDPAIPELYESA